MYFGASISFCKLEELFFSFKITIAHCSKGMWKKAYCSGFFHANHGKMGKKNCHRLNLHFFSLECQEQLFAPPLTDVIWIYFLVIHILGGTELPRLVEVFASPFLFWFWTRSCCLQLWWAVQDTRTRLQGWWAHVSYWRFKQQWQHHSSRCAAFMLRWILLQ